MREILISTCLLLWGITINAQTNDDLTEDKSFSNGLGAADYNFNLGTMVGTANDNSYWFSNYFTPSAKLDLTKRFSVVAGIGVRYTNINNLSVLDNEYNTQKTDAQITSFFTYASGIYKLNPKVNLNATVLYEENLLSLPETPIALQKQYKDVSLGVNYNVTKNFSINAQMHISDRPFNSHINSFTNFGTNSPFGYSPIF